MSTYAYRFVGQESLPSRLPDFDLEQFFQLTDADIAAVTERFRAGRRVAGALQLLYLRAMGHPMSQTAVIPRNLLVPRPNSPGRALGHRREGLGRHDVDGRVAPAYRRQLTTVVKLRKIRA